MRVLRYHRQHLPQVVTATSEPGNKHVPGSTDHTRHQSGDIIANAADLS